MTLTESLRGALLSRHPWVYRNHLSAAPSLEDGAWVEVEAGGVHAVGRWDRTSAIAIRLYSWRCRPDGAWLRGRVAEAWASRAALRAEGVTAFRWIYGEADGLPGVVVDRYGDYAVVMLYAEGLESWSQELVAALQAVAPSVGILLKRAGTSGDSMQLAAGQEPPADLVVSEWNAKFLAELRSGQKSGLFLDHRENRRYLARHAQGKSLLNLFAYTGGFSVHAALNGATQVTSVDLAAPAILAAERNFALNGLPVEPHEFVAEDVFAFLERAADEGRQWDIVVSDPPSFAKKKDHLHAAAHAYEKLHRAALRVVRPGGLFAAASCTSQIFPERFKETVSSAAQRLGLRLQLLQEVGQPLDHPVALAHPEGRYLKFLLCRVNELV